MTKTYIMNTLVEKMQSPDQDFRYMGLNDLITEIKQDPQSFTGDEATETKVLRQVMALVEDKISEVKNQAVKCLGQLTKIINENQMDFVIDKLITYLGGKDDELRDISGLALKTITTELPVDSKIAAKTCEKLAPRLLSQLNDPKTSSETMLETLSALSILTIRFPTLLSLPTLQPKPLVVLPPLLSHSRPAVRKRVIITLAQFVPLSPPDLFSTLMKNEILPLLAKADDAEKQLNVIQLVAAVARHSPAQIAPALRDIVPSILKAAQRNNEELRESSLQALEALVLRCPSELTVYLPQVIQCASLFIKYDPNYAEGGDDEDEEMADADDDDDAELDEYEDDEDTSYKIRRSATKLLASVIATRPELLASLYKEISPVLISRFGDREETVRLEVWATYGVFLSQTRLYGGIPQSKDSEIVGGKRKREKEGMEVEELPQMVLRSQVPALAKALLNQMKSRKANPAILQAGFGLLSSLLLVAPGSLANQTAPILAIAKSVLSSPSTTSTSGLHLSCLSFLVVFFSTHSTEAFVSSLPGLAPHLLKALAEKHPRIASESFRVFSALMNATKPIERSEWANKVYDEALQRLSHAGTDAEVRACAEECIGDLWICATPIPKSKGGKEWDFICRTTGRTDGAIKVVTKVAEGTSVSDAWVSGCIDWISTLLKKGGRSGKPEAFTCLESLLKSYQGGIPAHLPHALVPQMKHFVVLTDMSLLTQALIVVSLLLFRCPAETFPVVEFDLLKKVYPIAHSSLVSGAALDAVQTFFGALAEADTQIAAHIIPNLVISAEKAPRAETSFVNVSKCIAQVVRSQPGIAAGTITEFAKNFKPKAHPKPTEVVLSLLVLGELGRFIDMSNQPDIFAYAVNSFGSEDETIRTAAASAAGNIAIGNLHQFLPPIIKMIQGDPQKRLLSLHAIKEIVSHSSGGQLELVADTLWGPLFAHSEDSEETTRNVAAACLGKLTTTNPSRYLPQLHARINDSNPAARATVVSAIRYTFADTSSSYDDVLAPVIVDFLALVVDSELAVRRLALSALNSAARTKPNLIREHLPTILPNLYQETKLKPELVRTVEMGPWRHKVDDGLETRKTAYETMYTLLDTCLAKLDIHKFMDHVMVGLSDDSDEIKVLSHMMLFRLATLAPTAVAQRLDEATPDLEKTMKGATVTKDTVKQDLERAAELQRSALRAVAALSKVRTIGVAPKFDTFVATLQKGDMQNEFKELTGA